MRWRDGRRSDNVEDRRGGSGTKLPIGGRTAATGGGAILILVIAMLFGLDPRQLMGPAGAASSTIGPSSTTTVNPAEDQLADFVKVVLADTEDVWTSLFRQMGRQYELPTLVLFRDAVESACGYQQAAVGPFYCPADHKVFIDLSFYEQLKAQLNAPGDFAQAYVIAHEVGHHVQKLLGTSDKVNAARSRVSEAEANDLSVRLELQADFYAGVWAHHAQKMRSQLRRESGTILEEGDIEEALNAAAQIGDDTLQRRSRGRVSPESFTHGTAEQRMRWFKLGYTTGDLSKGDTFSAKNL